MANYLTQNEINEIELNPNNRTINFDLIDKISLPRVDIKNCTITGTVLKGVHSLGKGNLLNCELRDLFAKESDFEYVDFKDCSVKYSNFSKSSFDFGAIINNVFRQCIFEQCHFHNMSITESRFYNVDFSNCDLSNMVIKGCSFHNCKFKNCATSNKLIESSLIFDCTFENTDIQVETILENFGLVSENLISTKIRTGRIRDRHVFIQAQELLKANKNSSAFDRLKIAYFLDNTLFITGDDTIDEIFKIENWLVLCRIPSTFTNLLGLFLDFLLYEYEKDKVLLIILLKFQEMTSLLVEQVKIQQELYKSVMGVHMTLARYAEMFLTLLFTLDKEVDRPEFYLKVNGPVDTSYYEQELRHFLLWNEVSVRDVRKMNSPNILTLVSSNIHAISIIIGVLLSTRLKIELSKYYTIQPNLPTKSNLIESPNTASLSKPEELPLFNFELGLASVDEKYLYSIKLRSIMPGNLLTTLRLDISTLAIGKVRKILVDLIKKDN